MPRVRQKTKRGSRAVRAQTQEHRGGRPSKYSLAVAARICRAVRKGCSRDAAAGLAGITPATLYAWQNRFPEFLEGLEKADSRFEAECVSNIRRAGKSKRNWTCNAWLLERKFPHRYGKIDRHVVRTDAKPMPADFVAAIQRALGFTGELKPIGVRPLAGLLPVSGVNGPDVLDLEALELDLDVLPN